MKIRHTRQEQGDYYVIGPDSDSTKMNYTRSMAVSYAMFLALRASQEGRAELWQVFYGMDEQPLVSVVSHSRPSGVLVSIQPLESVA